MTSELEALKTNEFLRRRKLRIQQVREQSKDIAKKIRQRAKVESLHHIENLDSKKSKEYLEHQEKFVRRLELLYARGIKNVGTGHKNAEHVKLQGDDTSEKPDLSKSRGKEAAAELRQKRQEKLDAQKKILHRKLQAREAANEISREKSAAVANKLLTKSSSSKCTEAVKTADAETATNDLPVIDDPNEKNIVIEHVTEDSKEDMQGKFSVSDKWEPNIPNLLLPKDDQGNIESPKSSTKTIGSEKSRRPDLFAVSDEMPSSLRGGPFRGHEETTIDKPSMTLVSEYILSRDLRLREANTVQNKKSSDDLLSIKKTISKSRSTKNEEKPEKQSPHSASQRRHLVKMYNHATKDIQDKHCADKKLVTRDNMSEEDAYSLAMRESSCASILKERQQHNKIQDLRNKVAVSKEIVDKEYRDTMAFLKRLPNDSRPVKSAYKDEKRQEALHCKKQRLLQYEFKKIQKDCKKQPPSNKTRRSKFDSGDMQNAKDFQYSWRPVSDGDNSMETHITPTKSKPGKASTVTFASVDDYQYRPRHKHTPPTKDTDDGRTAVEAVFIDSSDCSSLASDTSSVDHPNSVQSNNDNGKTGYNSSDIEKIIINKILDSKLDEKAQLKSLKLLRKIAKNLSTSNKHTKTCKNKSRPDDETTGNDAGLGKAGKADPKVSFDQLTDGVYMVNEKGENMKNMCSSDFPVNDESPDVVQRPECSCQVKSKGNLVQWECADKPSTEKSHKTCKCKANSKHHSATPSGLSFQPIINEKLAHNEHGCLTILDDTGNEAGQFFIGATGLLKDNDYEVIIKLRKKDSLKNDRQEDIEEKENSTGLQEQTSETHHMQPKTQSIEDCNDLSDNAKLGTRNAKSTSTNSQSNVNPQSSTAKIKSSSGSQEIGSTFSTFENIEPEVQEQEGASNTAETVNSNDSNNNKAEPQKVNVDKGVCTTSDNEFALTGGVKEDPVPRATISTQTSLESPIHRPVSIQMSSSTSTAYLSPPDPIIPQYLKTEIMSYLFVNKDLDSRTHGTEKQEHYDKKDGSPERYWSQPTKPRDLLDQLLKLSQIDERHTSPHRSANCSHRQSKELPHAARSTVSKQIRAPPNTSRTTVTKQLKVPANAARSTANTGRNTVSSTRPYSPIAGSSPKSNISHSPPCVTSNSRCLKGKMTKMTADAAPKTSNNKSRSCKKVAVISKRSSKNLARDNTVRRSTKNIAKKIMDKTNLKPVIKGYVNKLLSLNKAGSKVVEVIYQDCSAVSTPGSSIIDVPHNIDNGTPTTAINLVPKISLEQLKETLIECLTQEIYNGTNTDMLNKIKSTGYLPRKKPVHKVKSLNISKHFFHIKSDSTQCSKSTEPTSTSSAKEDLSKCSKAKLKSRKIRSKSSPSPRNRFVNDLKCKSNSSDMMSHLKCDRQNAEDIAFRNPKKSDTQTSRAIGKSQDKSRKNCNRKRTQDLSIPDLSSLYGSKSPQSISTQTSQVINEYNFMKISEGKLQNMEKIADLTEKCTLRLSNLAKVLDEVRKSKSTHKHSRVSDSEPEIRQRDYLPRKLSEPASSISAERYQRDNIGHVDRGTGDEHNKGVGVEHHDQCTGEEHNIEKIWVESHDQGTGDDKQIGVELHDRCTGDECHKEIEIELHDQSTGYEHHKEIGGEHHDRSIRCEDNKKDIRVEYHKPDDTLLKVAPANRIDRPTTYSSEYTSFLADIPKPNMSPVPGTEVSNLRSSGAISEITHLKSRGKPPPALSRKILKHTKDVVPHELSTVVEVDSPVSMKLRNQSNGVIGSLAATVSNAPNIPTQDLIDPDLLQISGNKDTCKDKSDSINNSKNLMMDLDKFNDIMLKPFMSIDEYAKQCNIDALDEIPKLDLFSKPADVISDDVNSYNSENSLPDVIAELLKRKIINEPFRFDTVSNVNSTSMSSESTMSSLSFLALSKVRNERQSQKLFEKPESSDTMSISSNPDLEAVFKQLGMGWASSTLKKTKERLALSSSSDTSSSSLSHFKLNMGKNKEVPVTETISSSSIRSTKRREVEQQTSHSKSMTVKQFLAKELADKITFTYSPQKREADEEFVSLFETKVPENMQHSEVIEESVESARSGNNNVRARTSTPVRLFKSMTYHSSSGSGSNNGLFSNTDDLSSVKETTSSHKNHSTSEKDDLTIPNYSLLMKKSSDCSKSN